MWLPFLLYIELALHRIELLDKGQKNLEMASKIYLVRAAELREHKKERSERLKLHGLYERLLEAKGLFFGDGTSKGRGSGGRSLSYTPKSSSTEIWLVAGYHPPC